MTTMCVSPSSSTSSSYDPPPKTSRLLDADYRPDRCTVVVAKGHLATQALGNSALRRLVQRNVKAYSMAGSKNTKTKIVLDILEQVKEWNPDRVGFVKFHQGRWFESSDHGARDIITARFRDSLHDQYKSSTRCKVAKRRHFKAWRRAMKASGGSDGDDVPLPSAVPSSSASVISLTDDSAQQQEQPQFEPLPLDAPEPVVSSSFFKLEEMFQSRDDAPGIPLAATSSNVIQEAAAPPPPPPRVSFGRRHSSRSIAETVKSILGEAQEDIAPLESVVDGLCELEAGEALEFWAAEMLA